MGAQGAVDRGQDGPRRPCRGGRAARGAHRREPLPRAPEGAADARLVPLGPPGGRAAGLSGRSREAGRGAGHRAGGAPARPRTRDPRPGPGPGTAHSGARSGRELRAARAAKVPAGERGATLGTPAGEHRVRGPRRFHRAGRATRPGVDAQSAGPLLRRLQRRDRTPRWDRGGLHRGRGGWRVRSG